MTCEGGIFKFTYIDFYYLLTALTISSLTGQNDFAMQQKCRRVSNTIQIDLLVIDLFMLNSPIFLYRSREIERMIIISAILLTDLLY